MKVVRPRESKAETQPQPQPALLRFVGDDFPVPHAMHSALFALHTPKMGSVLTINTGCWFALTLGRAAPAANSIRGAIYHLMSRGDRREEIFRDVHIGQIGTTGGVMFFLCGGGGTPACPNSPGTVTGTVNASNIIGPPSQGVAAGEFQEAIRAMRAAAAYANVHTTVYPSGEIRGQINAEQF